VKTILIASDNVQACETIQSGLSADFKADIVRNAQALHDLFSEQRYDFLFIDVRFFPEGVEETIQSFKRGLQAFFTLNPAVQIVVMGPHEHVKEAVNAVKAGAMNYLTYPLDPDEVKYIVETTYEFSVMQSELDYLRDKLIDEDASETFQTNSPRVKLMYERIQSVALAKTTVLLNGETGTGKGVLAKLIHRLSQRNENKFISVHCGAIPDTLIESELFGHERGAFTGAIKKRLGKFEIAHGGTIFLDEIATVSTSAQIKLLQVLQDRTFQRVGGEETILCDARIIAATNTDLKRLTDDNAFRRDLYYRLSVFPIEVPPLRDRIEDIPLLVETFIKRLNKFYFKGIQDIEPTVLKAFEKYPWPGNIRELENLVERAYLLEKSRILSHDSFPKDLFTSDPALPSILPDTNLVLSEVRRRGVEQVERYYLSELLKLYRGSIKNTSRHADITTRQLHKLMKRFGIRKEDFKIRRVRTP